jgi:uncharacterized membrane protein
MDGGRDDDARTLRVSRAFAVATVLALVGLGLAWELWLAPTGARSLALKVLPLAALLPGLSAQRLRSYRVTSLLVWLYVAEGALRVYSDAGLSARLAGLQLLLCALLFAACVVQVRARTQRRAVAA